MGVLGKIAKSVLGVNPSGGLKGDVRNKQAGVAAVPSQRITNGSFATSSNWTLGSGWAIGSGVATDSLGAFGKLSQVFVGGPVASGTAFALDFDLINSQAALIQLVGLGSDGTTVVQTFYSNIQNGSVPTVLGNTTAIIYGLAVRSNDGLSYSIDNISLVA